MPLQALGKMLIALGLVATTMGALLLVIGRAGGTGRILPGDIYIERPGFTLWFPIMTSIVISILLSAVLWLLSFLIRR